MTDKHKEISKAVTSAGTCSVLGGGAASTVGGVGLAAFGTALGLSAAGVIAIGFGAGAVLGFAGYGAYRLFKPRQVT